VVGGIVPFIHKKEYAPLPKKLNTVDKNFNIKDHCIYFFNTMDYFEVDHIRSSFMYPNKLAKKIKFPTYNDDLAGFREETDFCLRVKHAGHKIIFVPDAVCWHLMAPYGGTRPTWLKYKERVAKVADERFKREMRKLCKRE